MQQTLYHKESKWAPNESGISIDYFHFMSFITLRGLIMIET